MEKKYSYSRLNDPNKIILIIFKVKVRDYMVCIWFNSRRLTHQWKLFCQPRKLTLTRKSQVVVVVSGGWRKNAKGKGKGKEKNALVSKGRKGIKGVKMSGTAFIVAVRMEILGMERSGFNVRVVETRLMRNALTLVWETLLFIWQWCTDENE